VEAVTVRLLPYAVADGPHNMAADEVLLQSAAAGTASLRFYGWSGPTVSLGYFQPGRLRRENPLLAGLPYVRRPSGGVTLVHHHEVTYALGLPAVPPWHGGTAWLCRMHAIIAAALGELGAQAVPHVPTGQEHFSGPLCFRHFTAGDLILGGSKVVGSAQRRHRGGLLQHGAILLARSPHTPALPGIRELTGRQLDVPAVCDAVRRAFERETGWKVVAGKWTEAERQAVEKLAADRYRQDGWNAKR
jgi:lipoate-protein ligase A